MTGSPFSLRQVAHGYCQFVLAHFGGIDGYQLVLYILILAFLCGVAFLTNERARPNIARLVPPWLNCLLLLGALFVTRLPTFLADQMNPDEGMLLAGAMKLRHYPVFWRSLDGTSSGPFNYYLLTLLNVFGLPLDYATARLANVICIGGTIAIVYCIARLYMEDWAARLTPLPVLAAAMAFRSPDLCHYSSECVSVLLIAFATWLLLAEVAGKPKPSRDIGIGALAAVIPLAKLQAAPMAGIILCAALAYPFLRRQDNKWRNSLCVAAGVGVVVVTAFLFLVLFREFETFKLSYIVNNVFYANEGQSRPIRRLLRYYLFTADTMWYERGIVAFCIGAACYLVLRGYRGQRASERWLSPSFFADWFALVLLGVSLYAVQRPQRLLIHYSLFLIFPLALASVMAFSHLLRADSSGPARTATRTALLFVLITLVLPGIVRGREAALSFNSQARLAAEPADTVCPVCKAASYFAPPGVLITVWGWEPRLYVLTRTLPATRDTFTQWQIQPGPLRDYYRRRFMEDLRQHPPAVFLDAVGPMNFIFKDRQEYGYETFPELRSYVDSNFYLAGDVDGVRIFARNGSGARTTTYLGAK